MALTPVDDVRVDGSKFYMKVGGKNTGFILV